VPNDQRDQRGRSRQHVTGVARSYPATLPGDAAHRPLDEGCGLCRAVGPVLRGCRCPPTGRPTRIPIVAVDIDGVLADTSELILHRLRRAHGLNLDRGALTTFRLADNPLVGGKEAEAVIAWLNAEGLRRAVPVAGAAAGVNRLALRAHLLYWTSRNGGLRATTEQWLIKHGFPSAPLVIAPGGNKTLVCTRFDACIDDDPKVVRFTAESGRVGFLFSQPWTAQIGMHMHRNIRRLRSWEELASEPVDWGRV